MRQAFHMEYYSNHFGQREKETMGEHTGMYECPEYREGF